MSKKFEARLRTLGFEIDWSVTSKDWTGWHGVMDPTEGRSIGGDCYGPTIYGKTKRDLLDDALARARELAPHLEPCPDPDNCDLHRED